MRCFFFSPSGVESHFMYNQHKGPVFCIGETTAKEAKKYTDKIIVAETPTITAVILKTIAYFKHKNL